MINTSLIYIENDNKYLMLHRIKKSGDINHDKWIGVGGHFEEGESPEECMLRETFEETGLVPVSWRFRGIVTFTSDKYETEYMHLFTSDVFEGHIKDCDEGVLEWVNKDHVAELPIWEGDKIFLRLLRENHTFFSLKLIYTGEKLTDARLDGRGIYSYRSSRKYGRPKEAGF